jgi:hypothetical protein
MRNAPADIDDVNELYLYAWNDGNLYRRHAQPIIQSLAKKKAEGLYEKAKAAKAFEHLMETAARQYRKEFGEGTFSPATRRAAAAETLDHYSDEISEYAKEVRKAKAKAAKPKAAKAKTNTGRRPTTRWTIPF